LNTYPLFRITVFPLNIFLINFVTLELAAFATTFSIEYWNAISLKQSAVRGLTIILHPSKLPTFSPKGTTKSSPTNACRPYENESSPKSLIKATLITLLPHSFPPSIQSHPTSLKAHAGWILFVAVEAEVVGSIGRVYWGVGNLDEGGIGFGGGEGEREKGGCAGLLEG
jgi:hypothetical protein